MEKKRYKIKGTQKQISAIKNMKPGKPIGQAMIDGGYSPESAKNPKVLTDSIGFKELAESCGLTDELILNSLVEDINAKPQKRVEELKLGAKIKNMLVDKVEHSGEIKTESNPIIEELANQILEAYNKKNGN